jgi:uncharacterized protein YbjT (DUF2867 family)
MILVVGGTGELGLGVVQSLRARGQAVSVLARPSSDVSAVEAAGAGVVRGDLLDPGSLSRCCDGADVVVVTANAIIPRRGERVARGALGPGYVAVAREARRSGVRRMITASVPAQFVGRGAVDFDERARIEPQLRAEGPPLTVLRASLFMQSWLPAVGSRLAVPAGANATLDRGYWLARLVGATTQRSIDRFGVALVPGRRGVRHSFIDVRDVGEAVAGAALDPDLPDELEVGGPEALSWPDVVDAHARALDRTLRRIRQPAAPFRILSRLARPASPAAAHLLAAQHLVSTVSSVYPPGPAEALAGRPLRTVQEYLDESARHVHRQLGERRG